MNRVHNSDVQNPLLIPEIFTYITTYLPHADLKSSRMVCSTWSSITTAILRKRRATLHLASIEEFQNFYDFYSTGESKVYPVSRVHLTSCLIEWTMEKFMWNFVFSRALTQNLVSIKIDKFSGRLQNCDVDSLLLSCRKLRSFYTDSSTSFCIGSLRDNLDLSLHGCEIFLDSAIQNTPHSLICDNVWFRNGPGQEDEELPNINFHELFDFSECQFVELVEEKFDMATVSTLDMSRISFSETLEHVSLSGIHLTHCNQSSVRINTFCLRSCNLDSRLTSDHHTVIIRECQMFMISHLPASMQVCKIESCTFYPLISVPVYLKCVSLSVKASSRGDGANRTSLFLNCLRTSFPCLRTLQLCCTLMEEAAVSITPDNWPQTLQILDLYSLRRIDCPIFVPGHRKHKLQKLIIQNAEIGGLAWLFYSFEPEILLLRFRSRHSLTTNNIIDFVNAHSSIPRIVIKLPTSTLQITEAFRKVTSNPYSSQIFEYSNGHGSPLSIDCFLSLTNV